VGGEDGGDGVGATTQGLGEGYYVGADVPVLVGEAGEGVLVDGLEVKVEGRAGRGGCIGLHSDEERQGAGDAYSLPVRPRPAWISSQMKRTWGLLVKKCGGRQKMLTLCF